MWKLLNHYLVPVHALLAASFLGFVAQTLPAAENRPDSPPAKAEKASSPKTIPGQVLDDPVQPFVPKKPRTAQEQNRLDALALFMTGQMLEKRGDSKEALDSYKKALSLDPKSVHIYQALVPLAFTLNQPDEAVKYALKSIELDPNDYRLLRRLAVYLAANRQVPKAIELLIQAIKSPELKDNKAMIVMLNRDLATLYAGIGEKVKTADAYEMVFDALEHPEKYDLNFRQQKSLEANPATTYEQIGQAFIDAERPELAVKAFEAALKARRGKPGTLSYNLAHAYVEIKQYDKALAEIQKYFDAQLQTKGRDAYELLAKIMKAKNQKAELIDRLEKMSQADPRNTTLQYFLAEVYLEDNQLDKAEAHYKKTLEGTKDPEGFAGLASVYRRKNQPAELLEALSQALDAGSPIEALQDELEAIGKDEKLSTQVVDLAKNQAADNNLKFAGSRLAGKIAARAKKTDDALLLFQLAMRQQRDKSSEIYEDIGGMYFDAEQYAKAAEWYRKAVNDPAVRFKPQFLFWLSQVEELAGNTEAALQAVKQALAVLPEVGKLHYQEAWIYYHAKRYDEALEKFDEVVTKFSKQDPEIARRSMFMLSSLYVQKGELRKGEEVLEKILAEEPDDPSVNNDLGYLYADHGKNLEKAKSMIQKAVKAEPENPAYMDSMGWVLYKLGEYKEAVSYLEKAVKLPKGGDSTIWDHLADCYARMKQMDKAKDAWKKALEDAKKDAKPDEKLIKRIEQKLAGADSSDGPDLP